FTSSSKQVRFPPTPWPRSQEWPASGGTTAHSPQNHIRQTTAACKSRIAIWTMIPWLQLSDSGSNCASAGRPVTPRDCWLPHSARSYRLTGRVTCPEMVRPNESARPCHPHIRTRRLNIRMSRGSQSSGGVPTRPPTRLDIEIDVILDVRRQLASGWGLLDFALDGGSRTWSLEALGRCGWSPRLVRPGLGPHWDSEMAIRDIGPLLGADETLNHQIVDTFATVAESEYSWTEKIWVSIARTDGSVQLDLGLGKYHNRGVIDGFAGVSRGREQWTVRGSRELQSAPEDTAIGPIVDEVIEPLRQVRVRLEPNAVQPISFDVVLSGVTPPFFEERNLVRNNRTNRVDVHVIRYHQGGWATGSITIDGETYDLKDENAFGS